MTTIHVISQDLVHAALRSSQPIGTPGLPLLFAIQTLGDEVRTFTLLPAVPDHTHTLDADGYPTCGCTLTYPPSF